MSSDEYLRDFVGERLTAAAEGISGAFQTGIVDHEAETDRLGRQLERVCSPEITSDTTELPWQRVCKEEEILGDPQICNQERNSGLDQEDPAEPPVKEEQQEVCISQEGEQLVLKEEADTFMLTPTYDNNEDQTVDLNPDETLSEPQRESAVNQLVISSVVGAPDSYLLLRSDTSHVAENQDQKCEPCDKDLKVEPNSHLKPYNCETCGKHFRTIWHLKVHMRTHTGELPYMCKTCGKHFTQSGTLKVHMRTHTGEMPYICETCGKHFTQSGNFKRHVMTIHTGKKPYICKSCGENFSKTYDLKVHMRTHTGEKPYMCQTCGGNFRKSCDLKVHIRTHKVEKAYICETCRKPFRQRAGLKRHMMSHTGQRPYMCKTCGNRFTYNGSLRVHMRTHTGDHRVQHCICETCGDHFRKRGHLKEHMKIHIGESVKVKTHRDSQE